MRGADMYMSGVCGEATGSFVKGDLRAMEAPVTVACRGCVREDQGLTLATFLLARSQPAPWTPQTSQPH
jgi:hypothetical protein